MQQDSGHPLVIWYFTDGKPGHENQTQGLLAALRQRRPLDEYRMSTGDCRKGMLECIRGHDPFGEAVPDPDLIIGAGHATHLPMLNARRIRGGKVIVLMKPTFPVGWFDLCVIPAHDLPRHAENVLVTHGVLNRVQPAAGHDPAHGLILVGGPSAHVNWSDREIAAQVQAIVTRTPDVHWQLATSRRTPEDFLTANFSAPAANLALVPVAETGPDWLPQQLQQSGQVWVTADSVSMIYEALTSGAAVGVLEVPYRKPGDRLARGLDELVRQHRLTRLADWQAGEPLPPPGDVFNEAARCADWIVDQWLHAS